MPQNLHLNPVGGIAGDMFIAAVLDLYPELENPMLEVFSCIPLLSNVAARVENYSDNTLTGRRFFVEGEHSHTHHHTEFLALKDELEQSSLPDHVRSRAIDILQRLSIAEGEVHGVPLEEVTLHEAGSADSLIDMLGAAFLIETLDDVVWSCDPLPVGKGSVMTQHGELPLPAPAVAILLRNFPVFDDGRIGERVTPTGAAIIQSLDPKFDSIPGVKTLLGSGAGFGTSKFQGISNVLRIVAYKQSSNSVHSEQIAVLEFEVDDQTPEDLAIGLEHIRAQKGVLDVMQTVAYGKKGRLVAQIQVLGLPLYLEQVVTACLSETATLGVRYQFVERVTAERELVQYKYDGRTAQVKVARRPGGSVTAKLESEHLRDVENFAQRKSIKQSVELKVESTEHYDSFSS